MASLQILCKHSLFRYFVETCSTRPVAWSEHVVFVFFVLVVVRTYSYGVRGLKGVASMGDAPNRAMGDAAKRDCTAAAVAASSGRLPCISEEGLKKLEDKFTDDQLQKLCFRGEPRAACLERWLTARKGDVNTAENMIRNTLDFRPFAEKCVADGMSKCLGADVEEVTQFYRGGYAGVCKEGRPVWYEQTGRTDIHSLHCLTNDENFIRYHVLLMEELQDKYAESSQRVGKTINKTLSVLDMEGITIKMLNSETIEFIKKLTKVDSNNYPETMGKMFLINTPGLFSFVWTLISAFLDPRTVSKIEILGGPDEWKARLASFVDQEQLPAELGGTGPSCLPTHSVFEEKTMVSGDVVRAEVAVEVGESCRYKFFTRADGNISFKIVFEPSGGGQVVELIPLRDYPVQECTNGSSVSGEVVAPGAGKLVAVWEHPGWWRRTILYRFVKTNAKDDAASIITEGIEKLALEKQ